MPGCSKMSLCCAAAYNSIKALSTFLESKDSTTKCGSDVLPGSKRNDKNLSGVSGVYSDKGDRGGGLF